MQDGDGNYHLVPMDDKAIERDEELGIIVRGNFDAFKSPIDGSVISTHREYIRHMQEHNVVPVGEFNDEFFERKRAEREALARGDRSSAQRLREKQEIYEALVRAERQNG